MIPAERRGPEKEETWTLAPDNPGTCAFFDDTSDAKHKSTHDVEGAHSRVSGDPNETSEQPENGTLPRSQETRKSKTKKVKSYLRKCKGALSKGDEASSDKKRQEHCASWYLDKSNQEDTDFLFERQSEFLEERIVDVEGASNLMPAEVEDNSTVPEDPPMSVSKEDDPREPGEEVLARLTENDHKDDLRRSRTSLYEDARDSITDRDCVAEEICVSSQPERNDAVSLETLTTEDTNLNKCDSNDTLIADVATSPPDNPLVEDPEEEKRDETRDQEADGETVGALSLIGVSAITY